MLEFTSALHNFQDLASQGTMSSATIVNLPRMSREQLAELIRSKAPGVAVVDVRDSDFIGGHIVGCQNVPTSTHDYRMPELVRTLKDQETVVFHCALSQQRGPSSALRYLRERERLASPDQAGTGQAANGEGEAADARSTGVYENKQKVYVLDGGFTKWQEA